MAKGMNAGIFMLLAVITTVLVVIALFFAYILRRAARLNQAAEAAARAEPLGALGPAAPPATQPIH